MKISEITSKIEELAPLSTSLDFDNAGLTVGRLDIECTGVLVTVDVTSVALLRAIDNKCNLIISHHPLIFTPIRNFVSSDYRCDIIAKAYSHGITIYSAHTNMDRFCENMSVRTLKEIGAKNVEVFSDGFGAIGDVSLSLADISKKVERLLDDNRTYTVGDINKTIRRVAMVNGAGADEDALNKCRELGVDLFISSEFKHHILLIAKEMELCLMSVGHYSSEKSFIEIIEERVLSGFDNLKIVKYYEGNLYN